MNLSKKNEINYSPPGNDELEISIFGPGRGEAILLHLGNNEWYTIDSCRNPNTSNPVALEYLKQIGISSKSIIGVVISHWHDDHIYGVSEILQNANKNAKTFISSAICSEVFMETLQVLNPGTAEGITTINSKISNRGITEISRILCIHQKRHNKNIANYFRYVEDGFQLFSNKFCSMHSIAPSPKVTLANFQRVYNRDKLSDVPIPDPGGENPASVVVSLKFEDFYSIFGGDLAKIKKSSGINPWDDVMNTIVKPIIPAINFKFPHHGSRTGHHLKFWNSFIDSKACWFGTAYSGSGLPRRDEVEEMLKYTSKIYLTTVPRPSKYHRKGPKAKKAKKHLRRFINTKTLLTDVGHIQIRVKNGIPTIKLNNKAIIITNKNINHYYK